MTIGRNVFIRFDSLRISVSKYNLLQKTWSKIQRDLLPAEVIDANHHLLGIYRVQMTIIKRLRFVKHSF